MANKDSQLNGRGGKKQQTLTLTDHNDQVEDLFCFYDLLPGFFSITRQNKYSKVDLCVKLKE
jgi:hypothetical protein